MKKSMWRQFQSALANRLFNGMGHLANGLSTMTLIQIGNLDGLNGPEGLRKFTPMSDSQRKKALASYEKFVELSTVSTVGKE